MSHNCEFCNYSVNIKSKLTRHFNTKKHRKNVENNQNFLCDVCKSSYKHRQSLYNHQIKFNHKNNSQCVEYKELNDNKNSVIDTIQRMFSISSDGNDKNMIIDNPVFGTMMKKIVKEAIEEAIPTIASNISPPTITNNNTINNSNNTIDSNNTINVQVFLNEYCKDAMTIQHFTKNLVMDIDDIVNKRKEKYFKGVSNVVIDTLKPIPITKRPIHCTDVKNSKWMVNDAKEGWTEDNGYKIIKQTESMLSFRFNELWREKYKDWENDDSKKDKWIETVYFLTNNIPNFAIEQSIKKISHQCLLNQSTMKEIMLSSSNSSSSEYLLMSPS